MVNNNALIFFLGGGEKNNDKTESPELNFMRAHYKEQQGFNPHFVSRQPPTLTVLS